MNAVDLHNLHSGTLVDVGPVSEGDLRDLHRLGFHPTLVTSQGQTMVKQLSPGFVFRDFGEADAEFNKACGRLLNERHMIHSVRKR